MRNSNDTLNEKTDLTSNERNKNKSREISTNKEKLREFYELLLSDQVMLPDVKKEYGRYVEEWNKVENEVTFLS